MPRARVTVGIVFLVLYVEFGKARVGNCAELLGRLCSWELCRVVGAMFGVALLGRCLELHSLICAFERLEMHSCNAELCRSCAHWVVGAMFGVAFLDLCI